MNVFLIPKIVNPLTCEEVSIQKSREKENNIFISETLHKYLISIKNQIDKYVEHWDIYKKYTNPYEYIHTLVPEKKMSVSKYKPLSRSFYKFIEICHTFDILPDKDVQINSFHLAEGPGGFTILGIKNTFIII